MLPLVVHQNTGGEELGCSRWSFTRTGGEELGCSRWSFTRTGDTRTDHRCRLHKLTTSVTQVELSFRDRH